MSARVARRRSAATSSISASARRARAAPAALHAPAPDQGRRLASLAGTLLFLSCADFDIWPLTWFAVVPLLAVALHPTTQQAGVLRLHHAASSPTAAASIGSCRSSQRFGHLPLIAAIPIFLLLVSYQAITFSVFAWAVRRLDDRFAVGVTFLAPVVYVACELVVPYVFPWYLAITQAWVRPVIQIADLTGPLGVSFLLVLCNGALYDAWTALARQEAPAAAAPGRSPSASSPPRSATASCASIRCRARAPPRRS